MEIIKPRDLLDDPRIREPWPRNCVNWNTPRDPRILDELEQILHDAEDERPLQEFFTKHPYLLTVPFSPHCCWIFPLPRLGGGKHIPDFLYCDRDSLGYAWTLIELESPKADATNKDGSVSKATHHAVEQIRDYRHWLTENALAEQKEYGSINAKCDGLILIGRREDRNELEQRRLADYREQHIEISSYDRLLYQAREQVARINTNWEKAAKMGERMKETKAAQKDAK